MHSRPRAILFSLVAVIALPHGSHAANPATTQADEEIKQLDARWEALQLSEPWASQALLGFYDEPDQTVAYFKEHLKPLKIEQKELDKALQALSSDDEKIWKPAFEKLQYLDPRLNVELPSLMNNTTEPLGRTRLIEILCDLPADHLKGQSVKLRGTGADRYIFYSGNGSWQAEAKIARLDSDKGLNHKRQWLRADRAIVLLQHIGTPAARAILKDMATGHPQALPTKVAKVAVESLANKDR